MLPPLSSPEPRLSPTPTESEGPFRLLRRGRSLRRPKAPNGSPPPGQRPGLRHLLAESWGALSKGQWPTSRAGSVATSSPSRRSSESFQCQGSPEMLERPPAPTPAVQMKREATVRLPSAPPSAWREARPGTTVRRKVERRRTDLSPSPVPPVPPLSPSTLARFARRVDSPLGSVARSAAASPVPSMPSARGFGSLVATDTLRSYAQRGIWTDLGLRLEGVGATSPGQRQAAELLLGATWAALAEGVSQRLGGPLFGRRLRDRARHEASAEIARIGETYGQAPDKAAWMAHQAEVIWLRLESENDITREIRGSPDLGRAGIASHAPLETRATLERIGRSSFSLGRLRLTYLLGTALGLGDHLRMLEDVPEHELACDDEDFEALLGHLWKGHKTDFLLAVYGTQRRALGGRAEGIF